MFWRRRSVPSRESRGAPAGASPPFFTRGSRGEHEGRSRRAKGRSTRGGHARRATPKSAGVVGWRPVRGVPKASGRFEGAVSGLRLREGASPRVGEGAGGDLPGRDWRPVPCGVVGFHEPGDARESPLRRLRDRDEPSARRRNSRHGEASRALQVHGGGALEVQAPPHRFASAPGETGAEVGGG
jgi:hypothetical protein